MTFWWKFIITWLLSVHNGIHLIYSLWFVNSSLSEIITLLELLYTIENMISSELLFIVEFNSLEFLINYKHNFIDPHLTATSWRLRGLTVPMSNDITAWICSSQSAFSCMHAQHHFLIFPPSRIWPLVPDRCLGAEFLHCTCQDSSPLLEGKKSW